MCQILLDSDKKFLNYMGFNYRINANLSCESQFLLKGHQMLNFLFAFSLKISETLKAHISGTEADINKR